MATPDEIRFLQREYQSALSDLESLTEELASVQSRYNKTEARRDAARTLLEHHLTPVPVAAPVVSSQEDREAVALPGATAVAVPHIGEFTGKRPVDAVRTIMERATGPLTLSDVVAEMEAGGLHLNAKSPNSTVSTVFSRNPDLYERVGQALYRFRRPENEALVQNSEEEDEDEVIPILPRNGHDLETEPRQLSAALPQVRPW